MQKGVVSPNVIGCDAKVGDVVLHRLPQAMEYAVFDGMVALGGSVVIDAQTQMAMSCLCRR